MSNRAHRLLPLLGALILGCEDPVAPVPEPDPPAAEPPTSTAIAAEASEEFEEPPVIHAWDVDVGFSADYAWAQAYMKFFANYANQTVDLWVRKGVSTVAHRTGESHASYIAPWRRTLWTHASARIMESCGHAADGRGRHEAANQIPVDGGVGRFWRTVKTSTAGTHQPSCATSCANMAISYDCDGDSGSSSGGSGTKTTGTTGSDGLECQEVTIVIYIDGKVFYKGPALLCE